jgi:hypothetical protein
VERSEAEFRIANKNMDELQKRLKPTAAYKVGLINSILAVNEENMKNLPHGFRRFRKLYAESCDELRKIQDQVSKELEKRKASFSKKKREMIIALPFVMALSLLLGLASAVSWIASTNYTAILWLASTIVVQVFYWALYFFQHKPLNSVGRYSTSEFDRIHLYSLALTETLHKFVANVDILSPSEASLQDSEEESKTGKRAS